MRDSSRVARQTGLPEELPLEVSSVDHSSITTKGGKRMNRSRNILTKHLLQAIFMGMLAILLLRTGGAEASALALSCGQWNIVPSPAVQNSGLHAVAVVPGTSNNIWAVGYGPPHGGLVEHWNGKHWKVVSNPYPNTLLAIAAISAKDIWATGYTGAIMHWNGKQWSIVPSPSNVTSLNAMAAISANDIWAAGGISQQGNLTPIIEHWDGNTWSLVPNAQSGALDQIAAISANDVWAEGAGNTGGTLTEHWDGTQWSTIPSPGPPTCDYFGSGGMAAISTTDVWIVGYYANCSGPSERDSSYTEHWDGTQWSIVPNPNPGHLYTNNEFYGVAAAATNNVWAVGSTSVRGGSGLLTEHWDGTQWNYVPNPGQGTYQQLDGVVAVGNTFWAVGVSTQNTPLIAFYCP
jgi:hypothetical protein